MNVPWVPKQKHFMFHEMTLKLYSWNTLKYSERKISLCILPLRNDLKMYKSKNLESIFIEIINTNNKNIVVGCVYRHPGMDANEFNEHYHNILNEKLLLEKNKEVILIGDFNINLLRYNEDHNSTDFLDQIYSCSLIPRITSSTRLTPRLKTLIDNIFSTDTTNEVIAWNILTALSDHLAQFLLFPIKRTKPESKANNYCRNFKRFDPKVFLQDLQNINWHTALKLDEENVDNSFDRFFQIIETLLDTYAPIEKLSRKKQKLMLKPWLTKGIMTSVKKRISSIENSSELDVMKKNQSYTINLKHTRIL